MSRPRLRVALDDLYTQYDEGAAIADPIHHVRRYAERADQEVAGFVAAGLAFGRVASVLESVQAVLEVMGPSPAAFVRRFDPRRNRQVLTTLGHRWIAAHDLAALFLVLRHMLRAAGSIEAFFVRGYDRRGTDVGSALDSFSTRAKAVDVASAYGTTRAPRRVSYFFPRPSDGSACKRLNLYLRWMVRHDRIDLGTWTEVDPAHLVVPLDVHVIRVGRCLRLTRYRSPGWPMAREITEGLRRLEPSDPVRYDFSLCHLGMQGACGFNEPRQDSACPLRGVCRPRERRSGSSRRPSGRR